MTPHFCSQFHGVPSPMFKQVIGEHSSNNTPKAWPRNFLIIYIPCKEVQPPWKYWCTRRATARTTRPACRCIRWTSRLLKRLRIDGSIDGTGHGFMETDTANSVNIFFENITYRVSLGFRKGQCSDLTCSHLLRLSSFFFLHLHPSLSRVPLGRTDGDPRAQIKL